MRNFTQALLLPFSIALCVSAQTLFAQESKTIPLPEYNLRSWSTKDGLPNDKIMAVYQSSQGYIWLGSQEGLARFDGARFEIFDKKNTPAFPHSQMISLIEDADSTLWISTIRGLVNYRHGRFSAVPVQKGIDQFITNTFFINHKGEFLIGTRTGVLRIAKDTVVATASFGKSENLSVYTFCEDEAGQIWVGTERGLKLFDGNEMKEVGWNGLSPTAVVSALCVGKDRTVWVGTSNGLFFTRNISSRKFEHVGGLNGEYIRSLLTDRFGDIWIGTEKSGLNRLAGGKLERITTREGLSADYVLSLCEDREGNLWAGTFYNGVDEIWRGKFVTYSTAEELAGPLVRAIAEAQDGTVWIGTESGLSRWKSGKVVSYTTKDGLPHDEIRSVFVDKDGTVWVGTRGGLSQFDGKHFKNYYVRDGLSNDYARVVAADFDGNLWIGFAAQGIDRFQNGKFTNMEKAGIPRVSIRVISHGKNRTMWIGTDAGLIRWREGKTTFYSKDAGIAHDVFEVYEDSDQTVWIGTYGDGLYRLKDEKITQITTRDGLFDDVVYQILEDDHQNFWMSSNRGVFRVPQKQLNDVAEKRIARVECISYNTSDGMKSSECNGNSQPAGIRTRDGRMWWPTTNGVAVINPSAIPVNSVPPEVTIEKLKVDSLSVDLENQVKIGAGYNYVEIQYAGLSFVVPEKMIFQYKLEGFDNEWKDAGTRRVAYYTNIPPGRYVFRVQARNNDGFWSKGGASLAMELRPYFYQTSWFYLLCAIVLSGSVFLTYRWRVALLLQREKDLQKRVNETIAQIKILGGLIPICANCKKIRDDKGYWNQLEKYLKDHSEAEFTHGICPECKEKLYGDYLRKNKAGA
jgi:ligand-binding sensor domain-containing protein